MELVRDELITLGRDRIKQIAEVPKMAATIANLKKELAECRAKAFNTPEYQDVVRRCCESCNENADLRKMVDEYRSDNDRLRKLLASATAQGFQLGTGGYPPPGSNYSSTDAH